MGIIAFIANITKLISLAETIIKLIKRNKLATSVIILFLLGVASCVYFLVSDNSIHEKNLRDDRAVIYINNILKKCKDRTAISVGTVSIYKDIEGREFWPAKFWIARACDVRITKNCLVDLKALRPELYLEKEFNIDISSYGLFVAIGQDPFSIPRHFHLRDKDDIQNLESVSFYPVIRKTIEELKWFEEGIIQDIWITTILNKNSDVLYIITFLSAKPQEEKVCFNHDSEITKLREFILNNNKH